MRKYFEKTGFKILRRFDISFIVWLIFFAVCSIDIEYFDFFNYIENFIRINIGPTILYFVIRFFIKKNIGQVNYENNLEYFRDCLDLPMLLISGLYGYNIEEDGIAAILFEFEKKGYIEFIEDEIKLNRNYEKIDVIQVQNLIENENSYSEFKDKISEISLNYLYREKYVKKLKVSKNLYILFLFIAIVSFFIASFIETSYVLSENANLQNILYSLFANLSSISSLVAIPGLVVWKYGKMKPYLRTKKGNDVYSKLIALESFLKDFTDIDDDNSYEKVMPTYYSYAILFGLKQDETKKYIKKLKKIM